MELGRNDEKYPTYCPEGVSHNNPALDFVSQGNYHTQPTYQTCNVIYCILFCDNRIMVDI